MKRERNRFHDSLSKRVSYCLCLALCTVYLTALTSTQSLGHRLTRESWLKRSGVRKNITRRGFRMNKEKYENERETILTKRCGWIFTVKWLWNMRSRSIHSLTFLLPAISLPSSNTLLSLSISISFLSLSLSVSLFQSYGFSIIISNINSLKTDQRRELKWIV